MGSIKKDIKSGIFSGVYLLYGQEDYLRDYYKNTLIKKCVDLSAQDFNLCTFNQSKPPFNEVESFFDSYPFMSEKKVIYIKNSGLFKKCNEDEKSFWINTFENLPDYGIVVFSEAEVDKRSVLFKNISKNHSCDEFPYQEKHNLISWISRHIAEGGREISNADCEYLIDCCGESMYVLLGETEKLINYFSGRKKITSADIDICCCKIPESRVFDMMDDIENGNIHSAAKKFSELRLLKEEPIRINGAIFSNYSRIRRSILLQKTMSPKEIALKTHQSEYSVKKQIQRGRGMNIKRIDRIMKMCSECDKNIKSGAVDGWNSIEMLFAVMTEGK